MTWLLVLLAAAHPGPQRQAPGPAVAADVDRNHVAVGDEIVFTVRATSSAVAPMQVSVPTISGFELLSRSERTEVSQDAGAATGTARTLTLELRLRAIKAGHWRLGPARAIQGSASTAAAPVAVRVDDEPGAQAVATNPMLRRLLARAPPPAKAGEPAVSLVISSASAEIGEQVDVLTAAWFPRDLRVRLRRPPTLQPPVVEGVWSYPQPVPSGIAASRMVGGTLYDLFVAHQVLFPLVAGRITIGPAVLKYGVPLALQFFSQEERFTLTSLPETLAVTPTPLAGRPVGYAGAVGQGLRVDRTANPPAARAGEPVSVAFEISGEGNPALWPAPDLSWPHGVRAYPDGVDEHVSVTDGHLGGSKIFRFTVVPDSAGPLRLPGATYPFFDVAAGAYHSAAMAPAVLAVARGSDARIARPLPPPLLADEGPPLAWRIVRAMPAWLVAILLLLPPLAWCTRRLRHARRRPAADRSPATGSPDAEARLERLLRVLVPTPEALDGANLVAALRTAGIAPEDAARLVELRERLRALRYGPAGGPVPAQLSAEARAIVDRLAPAAEDWRGARGGHRAVALTMCALIVVASFGASVGLARTLEPSPEQLYAQGELRPAADAFAERTAERPDSPANWYDLGAAYYRLGLDGRAAAAWRQASRLAPRERTVRSALELVPPPDEGSASRLWLPPVTWQELALAALPLWILGWAGLTFRPRRRDFALAALLVAASLGAAGLLVRRRQERPLAVVLTPIPLQLSPHERAPTLASLGAGSALLVMRRAPNWVMVTAPDGRLGWVEEESVFVLRAS
ncbi:MAG TPA: BatD family protein [Gemmatimonadales bacterium]|nr:BatD family protein [Gemmatimonadales bacterium]